MKVISVSGYKGGVSKTVTAVHLATFFSELGKTLLIDGDPNGSAISWAEKGNLPFKVVDQKGSMKAIGEGNDFIICDSPARPDSRDVKELKNGSDLLILPTIPDPLSLLPMLQIAAVLAGSNYRALIAINPPKPNLDGESMQAELREAGIPVFDTKIRRSIGIPKAVLAGTAVRDLPGRDRMAWLDYQSLGNEVLEMLTDD